MSMPTEEQLFALERFEGPYDLLLELARDRKLDITRISLQKLTDDFLAYLQQNNITADMQAAFIVVAATLLLLKVRQLLPSLTQQEEEEVAELTDRIRIYQLYHSQAETMAASWDSRPLVSGQAPVPRGFSQMALSELVHAMEQVIANTPKPTRPHAHLVRQGRSLKECLSLFSERISRIKKLIFQEEVQGESPQNIAVSFLAVLEMAKRKEITLYQEVSFQPLVLESYE